MTESERLLMNSLQELTEQYGRSVNALNDRLTVLERQLEEASRERQALYLTLKEARLIK